MTNTRYMDDMLNTMAVEHMDDYAEEIKSVTTPRSRAICINWHFDMLTLDVEYRFHQTIGCAKALAAIASSTPGMKKRFDALLRRTHADFGFIVRRYNDRDIRRRRSQQGLSEMLRAVRRYPYHLPEARGRDSSFHRSVRAVCSWA